MKINSIKGMNDLLPEQARNWRQIENLLHKFFTIHGYAEIRTPNVEKTELFPLVGALPAGTGTTSPVVSIRAHTLTPLYTGSQVATYRTTPRILYLLNTWWHQRLSLIARRSAQRTLTFFSLKTIFRSGK